MGSWGTEGCVSYTLETAEQKTLNSMENFMKTCAITLMRRSVTIVLKFRFWQ